MNASSASEAVAESETLSVHDALMAACSEHQAGRIDSAIALYERILEVVPGQADVLNFLGMALHHAGRSAEGLALIERSIAASPDALGPQLNRANVLLQNGRLDESAAAYDRVIELGLDNEALHNNLGALHRARGRPAEAERAYLRALALSEDADTHNNLARLYHGQGRQEDAIRHSCMALILTPNHPGASRLLGLAYQKLGRSEEAQAVYRQWLADEPDNPLPRHLLAAFGGPVPDRCSDAFVEREFDNFAASFDARLTSLHYRVPELIADALAAHCGAAAAALDVLDAGCGTGRCGPFLAPYARRLVGVDLSAGMLAQATARKLYAELDKAELTAYMHERAGCFDLIVSADTLCYFGVLDDAFAAAAQALRAGGLFIFSLEASTTDVSGDFYLHPHGRYSHARAYVERALAAAVLALADLRPVHLRVESGQRVEGWLTVAGKAAEIDGRPGSVAGAARR